MIKSSRAVVFIMMTSILMTAFLIPSAIAKRKEATDECKKCLNKCVIDKGNDFSKCLDVRRYDYQSTPITNHGICWTTCGKISVFREALNLYKQCNKSCDAKQITCKKQKKSEDKCRFDWMVCRGRCEGFNKYVF